MRLITSESVSKGHPDKIADQISDAILDNILSDDKFATVAVETMVKDNCVVLGGEITTSHPKTNYNGIIKNLVKDIGYTDPEHGFYYKNLTIINLIGEQSTEINSAVVKEDLGAGDQGFMTGYADGITENYMPLGIYVSKKLVDYVLTIENLGPDAKSQVTVEYDDNLNPLRIHTILISTQHSKYFTISIVRHKLLTSIKNNDIKLQDSIFRLIDKNTKIYINPAGSWNIGGPVSDCGVTGRKIVVDQYGPYCPIGGGAFSGKDFTKVDRTGSYLCRYIAKNIVASGLAKRCGVEISYMIGESNPTSININTFGHFSDDSLLRDIIMKTFPIKPIDIINHFDMRNPIYLDLSSKSHFGRNDLPWEKLDKVDMILDFINKNKLEKDELISL